MTIAYRKPNAFEKVLLFIGIVVIVVGYILIHSLAVRVGFFSGEVIQSLFLWVILITLIIMTAVSENMKEELKIVISNQATEIKLLRHDLRRK